MLRKIGLVTMLSMTLIFHSCSTHKKVADDDFSVDATESSDAFAEDSQASADTTAAADDLSSPADDLSLEETPAATNKTSQSEDEFAEFDTEPTPQAPAQDSVAQAAPLDDELNLDNEMNALGDAPTPPSEVATTPAPEVLPNAELETVTPPEEIVQTPVDVPPPVVTESEPPAEVAVTATPQEAAKINEVQYKGNDNGGAVVISSNRPLTYTTRMNSVTNQIVVEIQNVVVPNNLKRPLNTKDMTSSIGTVDVYQKSNSNVARFVVQLRPNSPEPLIQPEGNSLLILGSALAGNPAAGSGFITADSNGGTSNGVPGKGSAVSDSGMTTSDSDEVNVNLRSKGIMSTADLEDFLANNNKFYGKKISIETTDMDIRDAMKFISEESGINMIFDDDVAGKISVKLRHVPWDQALVIMLKSKKLAYKRQGSILRIAQTATIFKEDEDAIRLKEAKATVEPLIVRNFSINYAEIDKLEIKVKDFINDTKKDAVNRGKVTSDPRTNILIVTETAEKLAQVEQLLKALDTQPQQVLIEARLIEASENYSRKVGFNWSLNAVPNPASAGRISTNLWDSAKSSNPVNISPTMTSNPTGGGFTGGLWLGTLGAFGGLDAQLSLDEFEDKIKILSSPRVTVLTNTPAKITQGFVIQVPKTASTTVGSEGAVTQTFEPKQLGVELSVTPQVSNIGTVKLTLNVKRAALGSGNQESNRDVTTQVIVKDGQTAIIGGVFTSDVNQTRQGIPGLKDIPILGTLFRGESDVRAKTELMIFVTPKIVRPLDETVLKASVDQGMSSGPSFQDAAPSEVAPDEDLQIE